MKSRIPFLPLVATAALGFVILGHLHNASRAADPPEKLPPGILCSICDQPVSKDFFLPYKGGRLYFACPGCQAEFEAEPQEYLEKANLQLVLTRQFKQVACPITGEAPDARRVVTVEGIGVAVCCPGCQGKLASAQKKIQRHLVFGETGFDRAFKAPVAKR